MDAPERLVTSVAGQDQVEEAEVIGNQTGDLHVGAGCKDQPAPVRALLPQVVEQLFSIRKNSGIERNMLRHLPLKIGFTLH